MLPFFLSVILFVTKTKFTHYLPKKLPAITYAITYFHVATYFLIRLILFPCERFCFRLFFSDTWIYLESCPCFYRYFTQTLITKFVCEHLFSQIQMTIFAKWLNLSEENKIFKKCISSIEKLFLKFFHHCFCLELKKW